ncbi:MAG: hypothetical protein JXO51_09800 [Candidatus Aminicenantes bacterium]|nr:hypothetical protein [Candidatus Aminicenantes bacterium]
MRVLRLAGLCLLLCACLPADDKPAYRLEYQIQGSVISRLLLVFPIRVYYEAAAAVELTSCPQPEGSVAYAYAGLAGPAAVLRTLGFSGRTLALLSAVGGEGLRNDADDDRLSRWRREAPEFASKVRRIKKFPYRLVEAGPQVLAFERDASGIYRNFTIGPEPRYRYHPARTGIYFNVFSMLAEMLNLLNRLSLPGEVVRNWDSLAPPSGRESDGIDLSPELNRLGGLLEKAVGSLVTVEQEFPFRLRLHVAARGGEEIEICGECFPDMALWKGFMIREVIRRLRLRAADGVLLADELWVGIRNSKGHGGFGRLRLERIEAKEVER